MSKISRNLLALRKNKNLTVEQIATAAGIDSVQYEQIECGFKQADFDVLSRLAHFYGVDTAEIVTTNYASDADDDDGAETLESALSAAKHAENANPVQTVSQNATQSVNQNMTVQTEHKDAKRYAKFPFAVNIVTMILAALAIVWYFAIPLVTYSGSFNTPIGDFNLSGSITCLDLLTTEYTSGFYNFIMAMLLIFVMYDFVNAIILAGAGNVRQSEYLTVSKIMGLTFGIYDLIMGIYLIVELKDGNIASAILYAILLAVILILNIVFFVKVSKDPDNVKELSESEKQARRLARQTRKIKTFKVISISLLSILIISSLCSIYFAGELGIYRNPDFVQICFIVISAVLLILPVLSLALQRKSRKVVIVDSIINLLLVVVEFILFNFGDMIYWYFSVGYMNGVDFVMFIQFVILINVIVFNSLIKKADKKAVANVQNTQNLQNMQVNHTDNIKDGATGKFCSCGEINASDAVYCRSCGRKLL